MVTLFTTSKPHYKPNRLPQNFMLSLMKWQVFRFWGFCGNIFEATFFQIIAKLKEQPLNSCGEWYFSDDIFQCIEETLDL